MSGFFCCLCFFRIFRFLPFSCVVKEMIMELSRKTGSKLTFLSCVRNHLPHSPVCKLDDFFLHFRQEIQARHEQILELSLTPSLYLSLFSLSLTLSVSLYLSICLPLSTCLSLSISLYLSLSLFLSLCLSLSLSLSLSLYFARSLSIPTVLTL